MANNTGFSDCWTYPKEVIDEKLGAITQQYESIQAAGDAAVAAVEEKGEEVLESIPADYSELSADVSELKEDFNSEIGYYGTVTPSVTLTDGYTIQTAGSTAGNIVESASYAVSDKISLVDVIKVNAYYTGQNSYGGVVFYTENDGYISHYAIPSSASQQEVDVPQTANYLRYSVMKARKNVTLTLTAKIQGAVYDAIDTKLDKNLGASNDGKILTVGSDGNITTKYEKQDAKPIYMRSRPIVPLMPEMCADFAWCSMLLPSAWTGHNVVMTVSGSADSKELTVTNITGGALSDMGAFWVGGVLTTDGSAYKVYNFKYKTATTLEIYPALDATVSGATLATLMYDSGESYTGLHLTEDGYKAYAYYLYNTNPKHCEVGKYVAQYRPYIVGEENPLTKYGGTIYTDVYSGNRDQEMLTNYTGSFYRFLFSASYASYEQKTGVYWEVDLKGKSGYLEVFLNAISDTLLLPTGQEVYVDVYIDGELISQTIITDRIGKRVVVDYENASTGKVDIYSNKFVNGTKSGFYISRIGWWVNELDYADTEIFPRGAVIAQEFDSWGVFHDGASGVALSALHNSATGVTVPYTNHSLGNQTSAWGKAWFYENVWKYNPAISITDFVINDANSMTSESFPTTIQGPDGRTYDNKLTEEEYADNQKTIITEALSNDIQPILMRACQHGYSAYIKFTLAFIDAFAEIV